MSDRKRHEWRVYHPSEQAAILKRLRGESMTPEELKIVEDATEELERILKGRKRRRRLPSERVARKVQRALFTRRVRSL